MFRVAMIYKDGTIKGYNVDTKEEADELVLKESEHGIKRADIVEKGKQETRKKIW